MTKFIKQAVLKVASSDGGFFPEAEVSYNGNDVDVVRQSVYGVCSNPPVGSNGILFTVNSANGVKYAILDYMTGRFKNLEAGEVQIGNYLTQASVKFDKDGNVTINIPSGDLSAIVSGNTTIDTTDLTINASGTSLINGGLTVSGDITANNFISSGISVDFNNHIHTGDSGGNTSTPK